MTSGQQPNLGRFRRDGIYGNRLWWMYPWGLTRWWRPGLSRGGDEWCNKPWVITVPLLGALVIYFRPPSRMMPCPDDWEPMNERERADYAPCGWLHGGHLRPAAHHHIDTWPCPVAQLWLAIAAPEPAAQGGAGK